MKKTSLFVAGWALLALAGGEACAQGSMGQVKQKRCINGCQMQMRQQMRDGSCMNNGSQKQGNGQGRMRRMGATDGAGSAPGPQEETGNSATTAPPSEQLR